MIKSKTLPKYRSIPQYGLRMGMAEPANCDLSIIKKLSFFRNKKVVLAGGYFTSTKSSDIDLFTYDMKNGEVEKLIRDFAKHHNVDCKICHNCVNTTLFKKSIQIVTIIHDTIMTIFNNFDIDACKIGYDFYTKRFIYTSEAEKALKSWTIRLNTRKFYEKTGKRYIKYIMKKGFSLDLDVQNSGRQIYYIYNISIFVKDGQLEDIVLSKDNTPKLPMFEPEKCRLLSQCDKLPIKYSHEPNYYKYEKMKVITL